MADRLAHCTIFSTVVVSTGISSSGTSVSPPFAAPVERAFAPHVDVPGREQREERYDLPESGLAKIAKRDRPRVQERHLDVEEQEDHRHEVELDRLALAGVADRGHAALVRRFFLGT